ncbi:MAG: sulfite exporter TauE/SafE family protein [Magnetococcales bacterium]|nr:sulfite exporter TauE/SafE family protein [Magnetococcales bacterium]
MLVALLLGLTSTLHCLGMCGGIIGALSMSLPDAVRQHRPTLLLYVAALNIGRLLSYTLAGAAAGFLGQEGSGITGPAGGHTLLQILASLVLVMVGLYLTGRFPLLAGLERLGTPLWLRIEPWWRRLLPLRSPGQALLLGVIWGWLPCFLVYATLLLSLSMATPLQGALTMVSFGVGTLPMAITTGLLAGFMMQWRRATWVRWTTGLFFILSGILTLPGVL